MDAKPQKMKPMPIKPAPCSAPVLRKGVYTDPETGVVYSCDRWEHDMAEGSGIKIYATGPVLGQDKCVITGYSINISCPHISLSIPPGTESCDPMCEPGYVEVCVPGTSTCWCEWDDPPQ